MYISYLMGASRITDPELHNLVIEINHTPDGDRELVIPDDSLAAYKTLVREKLDAGFWNDIIGEKDIIFIFKCTDTSIKEYILSNENKEEISALCSKFTGDSIEKTSHLHDYLAHNSFYRNFFLTHYTDKLSAHTN